MMLNMTKDMFGINFFKPQSGDIICIGHSPMQKQGLKDRNQ